MVPRLTAVGFMREMTAGRTGPVLCRCADQRGAGVGEYVVKLQGSMEQGSDGSLSELLGSLLASHFGIMVPEPAVVEIDRGFGELLSRSLPTRAVSFRNSIGPNFASRLVFPMATWPVDRGIPTSMFAAAVRIFAFDALIKNPDRRHNNPNLFTSGDEIWVFDHECSFSFLLAIGRRGAAWELEREVYLRDHVFFHGLRGRGIDLSHFLKRLSELTDPTLERLAADVPKEWTSRGISKIAEHLRAQREHAEGFAEQLRRRLA
jgi:HipA-like protein